MPQIGKHTLGQFIRTGCQRQLGLNLYPDNATHRQERQNLGMPYPQSPRPGLRQVQAAGDEWQEEKLHDLTQTFGTAAIIGTPTTNAAGQVRYRPITIQQALTTATPINFIVEGQFAVGNSFKTALNISGHDTQFNLQYAELRPDIVAVLAPLTFSTAINPDGSVFNLPTNDHRRQLRIVDIKLTAHASPAYFAEVVFYSMAMAGWLIDNNLQTQYVVVPDGAVWPGSYEASNLVRQAQELARQGITPTVAQLWEAMTPDLELVPFEVFVLRVRRFLQTDVPEALSTPWRDLQWHVDSRCSFCEYLGEDRPPNPNDPNVAAHDDHCLPTAEREDHISRVAFVSQGARLSLEEQGVVEVATLAQRNPTDGIFDVHQTLRATRTVISGRAIALQTGLVAIPPQAGTSAGMPKWADLHVYLSVDFDIGSAVTVAFGMKAFWYEPRGINSPLTTARAHRGWNAAATVVDQRDIQAEGRELLAFLQQIHGILEWCRQQDEQTLQNPALVNLTPNQKAGYRTKVQFYLWDSLQFEHLARIIGRHLHAILANPTIDYLAWLFPPEDILPNPDMATRRSPLTIVREVVKSLIAAPIAHYYSLLEVARAYHEETLPPNIAAFHVHPLFATPLSDQIPSERAHEIWGRVTNPRHWQVQLATLRETVEKRLSALETVTKRLEGDLRQQLAQTAPVITAIARPNRVTGLSVDGQLWQAFAQLNVALEELQVHQIRAMPPHERAARFHSARLVRQLTNQEYEDALATLGLEDAQGRRIYELAPDSVDVKAKVGDFSFAIVPENEAAFLDRNVPGVVNGTGLEQPLMNQLGDWFFRTKMEELLSVTVAGLDRNNRIIALDSSARWPTILDDLESEGIADLSQNAIIDPVHKDFFVRKLTYALRAIGNPPSAGNNSVVRRATGQVGRGSNRTAHTPTADFLWNLAAMGNAVVQRNLAPARQALQARGQNLDQGQWRAWEEALSRRARLVWGPPGTGKSQTVRAILTGAILEASQAGRPCRVLLTASTYTAIDNVLLDIGRDIDAHNLTNCPVYRLRSKYQGDPGAIAPTIDLEINKADPSQEVQELRELLANANELVIVGATSEQVFNLLTCNDGAAQAEWFDLIVVDEASQMDVAHAILPMCAIASNGAVILAGDKLQLPPIHQAEPPLHLEHMVGPIYSFFEREEVGVSALDTNYRSNETIVSFARLAGYRASLSSFAPNLALQFTQPLPAAQPANWPASLVWIPEWNSLLDPNVPAVCFVYIDGRSSQRNIFEANAVAALTYILHGNLSNTLLNDTRPPQSWQFWTHGVGIVTPHRAQQGLITSRLQEVFNATGQTADAIRNAVDTVERFQGQQRDIIIASYTLGDPDQIAEEEEFLMSLNRFNVIASRARAKLIVLISQEVVSHLAGEIDVLRESRLLKVYAESFCNQHRDVSLGYIEAGTRRQVDGVLRWHG